MKCKISKIVSLLLALNLGNCEIVLGDFEHGPQRSGMGRTAAPRNVEIGERDSLYICARTLLANNELAGARSAIDRQLQLYPEDGKARILRDMIVQAADEQSRGDRRSARAQMLSDVEEAWKIGEPTDAGMDAGDGDAIAGNMGDKLAKIIIPQARFIDLPISQAVEMISELSIKYDTATENPYEKGVNIVLVRPPAENEPKITLNLRNISLERLLFYVSQGANYKCDYGRDAVIIGDEKSVREELETRFFPLSRATVIRFTGKQDWEHSGADGPQSNLIGEELAIKNFLMRAGVEFGTVAGSNLAFDGSQIIVTHTLKNLRRIERILQKYSQARQVEIEAKFLEVTQGALDELAFRWNLANRFNGDRAQVNTGIGSNAGAVDSLRTLAQVFAPPNSGQAALPAQQDVIPINNQPPTIPGQINVGVAAAPLGSFLGVIDRVQVGLMIRALEQKTGSDLMSAPKLTVLSGKTANIIVARELRYPQSYGETHSEVGSGSPVTNATSAGVTITAGTPRDFTTRNIGVEMRVTPTVEDDANISLRLEPKVTEFEKFMEYGGMNVAVAGGKAVYISPGFFQPIFSIREIRTEVTVQNGWTVVMGGLTREEIKTVDDKIPLLGDIPLLGKLFRSRGETVQKRNLLIFVTARTVAPSGVRFQRPRSGSNFQKILAPQVLAPQ